MRGNSSFILISHDQIYCFIKEWARHKMTYTSDCSIYLGHHHNVPLYIGPAAALHGLSDSRGAHVEKAAVWTLAAYPE